MQALKEYRQEINRSSVNVNLLPPRGGSMMNQRINQLQHPGWDGVLAGMCRFLLVIWRITSVRETDQSIHSVVPDA